MNLFLADYSDTGDAAVAALFGFLWNLLVFIYAIFILVCLYKITRRLTQIYELLEHTNPVTIVPPPPPPQSEGESPPKATFFPED
jgi:hypothetical protein